MCTHLKLTHLVALVLVSAGLSLAGCGDAAEQKDETHDGPRVSDQGLFEAHVTPEPAEPTTGQNELMIHLMDADGAAVAGAALAVEPWMPAHGHGSPEDPVVTEDGDGMYTVTNLVYSMPGHWEVRIDIEAGQQSDLLVLEYDVE